MTSAKYAQLGALIQQCRLARGLTQKQLAEKLGTNANQVIRWEEGTNRPQRYSAALARELGLELAHVAAIAAAEEALAKAQEVIDGMPALRELLQELVDAAQHAQDPPLPRRARR